MRLKPPLLK